MKMVVFLVVAPCSLVEVYQRFTGACCLHHQGDRTDSCTWGHGIKSWSGQLFCFMQPPCCYFTLYKELIYKILYFPKVYNHTSLYDPIVSGANVDPTSQVRSPY
jgi:hypothetical protein